MCIFCNTKRNVFIFCKKHIFTGKQKSFFRKQHKLFEFIFKKLEINLL